MHRGKTTGQFKPDTAADTPDPTAIVEHRPQLFERLHDRQIALAVDVTQRLRTDPTGNRIERHKRRQPLLAQHTAHAHRDKTFSTQRPPHYHRLPGGQ
ncbi:hypothetical protein D3C81_1378360 [compost metagenome]